MVKTEVESPLRVGFKKEIQTVHYPITVVEALDRLLAPSRYKRLGKAPQAEEFIWENDKNERFTVDYYTKVNSLTHSRNFDPNKDLTGVSARREFEEIYVNLKTTLGNLSKQVGYPYISTERQLILAITGSNLQEKADAVVPIVKEIYLREEKVNMVSVDVLDQSSDSIQILFDPEEL